MAHSAAKAVRNALFISSSRPISAFLVPCVFRSQPVRPASILSSLANVSSSYHKRKRVGRGPSSGKGKTSGRGQKGQKAHGKVPAGFEGGQTPLLVVKGKRGYDNPHSIDMSPVNLDTIQTWIDQGRLDPSQPITVRELVKSRCIHGVKDGVKLLGRNCSELKVPIKILVSRASASAIAAVEAAGGSVTTRYYTKKSIKQVVQGLSPAVAFEPANFDVQAIVPKSQWKRRLPDPTSRKDIEYYRDPAHRGYLVDTVQEGEGPSLFFKLPSEKAKKANAGKKISAKAANRMY